LKLLKLDVKHENTFPPYYLVQQQFRLVLYLYLLEITILKIY